MSSGCLGALNERPTEAHLFDFFREYTVPANVLNTIIRPNQLMDPHASKSRAPGTLK